MYSSKCALAVGSELRGELRYVLGAAMLYYVIGNGSYIASITIKVVF